MELIRNVNRVRKVRLEDVVRVSFDAMEKVIISGVEQVGDDRHVIATVTEPFAASQQRVESRAVRSRATTCPTTLAPRTECARQPSRGRYRAATRSGYHASAALASRTADWCQTTGE